LALKRSISFRADRANVMVYSDIQLVLLLQCFSDQFQRLAWFIGSLTRDQAVVEIFPEFVILLQVNQNGGFFTCRIRDKLDAL